MTTQAPSTSPLGYGLSATFCTALLPFPGPGLTPTMVPITCIQPTLGLGKAPGVSDPSAPSLPDVVAGRQLLAEAVVRRINTARGTLPDTKAPTTTGNYGIDIQDMVDADMTASDAGKLAASIDAQIRQDERVFYTHTTATLANSTLTIVTTLVDGSGPFKLTLQISLVTGALLGAPT